MKPRQKGSGQSKIQQLLFLSLVLLLFITFFSFHVLVSSQPQHENVRNISSGENSLIHQEGPSPPGGAVSSGQKVSGRSSGGSTTADEEETVTEKAATAQCIPNAKAEEVGLRKEVQKYQKSANFLTKIQEVSGEKPVSALHVVILNYLQEHLLENDMSILDLGCAAGAIVQGILEIPDLATRAIVGVELVPKWVEFASQHFGGRAAFVEGDIEEFSLPDTLPVKTFDMVLLNDVLEHVQASRYYCLLDMITQHTHAGSMFYMHTPSAQSRKR